MSFFTVSFSRFAPPSRISGLTHWKTANGGAKRIVRFWGGGGERTVGEGLYGMFSPPPSPPPCFFPLKSGQNQVEIGSKSGPNQVRGWGGVGAGGVGLVGRGPVAPRKVSTLQALAVPLRDLFVSCFSVFFAVVCCSSFPCLPCHIKACNPGGLAGREKNSRKIGFGHEKNKGKIAEN